MQYQVFVLATLAAWFLAQPAALQAQSVSEAPKVEVKADTAKSDANTKSKETQSPLNNGPEKPFNDVTKGYKAVEGLFTLYVNEEENKVLMEVLPEQLDKIFLCNVTLEAGDGLYFDSGAMLDNFPFILKRIGKRVQFIHKNVYYRTETGSSLESAVERGVSSSIVSSARIESRPHPERKSLLIDVSSLFLQDYAGVETALARRKIDFRFDRGESYLGPVKSFALNTEIEAVLHFKNARPRATDARISDGRSMQHRYRYSLSTLPKTDYKPRVADDRVGHFLTLYQDYTDPTSETPYVRYINRWQLEKADPQAPLSPPKQPIVFWLEKTIPPEHRQAVSEGVTAWNRAFEKIGIKDALVVREQPVDADWDPADVRYNTIRWIVNPGSSYAVGPSRTDPFTGQIYDADIRVSADIVRFFVREREEYVQPLTAFSESAQPISLSRLPQSLHCTHADGLAQEAAFGFNLLAARGDIEPGSAQAKLYVHNAIRDLVAHEVGHTLGLRHNFRASTVHTPRELRDRTLTSKEGVSGSVMDYNPVNIAPKGHAQGDYWNTTLGVYDYWAIEYAYKPTSSDEVGELRKIASRSSEGKLAYGTDEDAFGSSLQGVDPTANLFDLGSDPIAFYRERLALSKELLTLAERKFDHKGEGFQKMRRIFTQAMRAYSGAAGAVPKFVGGLYHRRDHMGDPGKRVPFEPVSAKKQQEALAFLNQQIFGANAFSFAPSLVNKLTPERFDDFNNSLYYSPRVDYPVHSVVLDIQKRALNRLYSPITLNRLLDLPLHYKKGQPAFTMADMFVQTRSSIWEEVFKAKPINSFRRNLQRAHLAQLTSLAVQPRESHYFAPGGDDPAGSIAPPEDAMSLARADLLSLKQAIGKDLLQPKLDTMTRAHLQESLARIETALSAEATRSLRE